MLDNILIFYDRNGSIGKKLRKDILENIWK